MLRCDPLYCALLVASETQLMLWGGEGVPVSRRGKFYQLQLAAPYPRNKHR
jgi:hypothetical protein